MRKKFFIMAVLAMIFSAVEGYAQRGERGSRGKARMESPARSSVSRSAGAARYRQPARSVTRSSAYRSPGSFAGRSSRSAVQRNYGNTGTRSPGRVVERRSVGVRPRMDAGTGRYVSRNERRSVAPVVRRGETSRNIGRYHSRPHMAPPPPHRPWRPIFSHHHSYWHHRHYCYFDNWYWYNWGGYRHRFICHRLYHNRFFDSLLGYYVWGALTAPTRLDIGNMSFTRYSNRLKIQVGSNISYLDLYRSQTISYTVGYTSVEVTTGNGSALVYFYDEYGNEASYRL